MRRLDHLNGFKSWWNCWAKPEYKTMLPAEQLKLLHFSEWENTGTVEMRAYQCKLNRPLTFEGR